MARAPQSLGTLNPEPFVFVDGVGWAVFASSVLLCGCFASGVVWRGVVRLASVCLVSVVSLVAVIAVAIAAGVAVAVVAAAVAVAAAVVDSLGRNVSVSVDFGF